jgi:hypothetical protein
MIMNYDVCPAYSFLYIDSVRSSICFRTSDSCAKIAQIDRNSASLFWVKAQIQITYASSASIELSCARYSHLCLHRLISDIVSLFLIPANQEG